MCQEKGTGWYANHVEEVAGKTEVMNVFEYQYETKDKHEKIQIIRFRWISSLEITKRNLEEMILAARGRWKIDNEESLSADTDSGHSYAVIYRMESVYQRTETEYKKYIFLVTGKFSTTNSNIRRCILHSEIHDSIS